jgi:hypothetical protein
MDSLAIRVLIYEDPGHQFGGCGPVLGALASPCED